MRQIDSGRASEMPTWRYWTLVVLVLPSVGAGVLLGADTVALPLLPLVVVMTGGFGALLAQERAVRRMPPPRRLAWSAGGCVILAAVALTASVVLFTFWVAVYCPPEAKCFS